MNKPRRSAKKFSHEFDLKLYRLVEINGKII